MTFAPLDLHAGSALAVTGSTQLRDRHCLIELGNGAEDLPNEPRRRRILDEGLRAVGRDQLNAALGEHGVAAAMPSAPSSAPRRPTPPCGPTSATPSPSTPGAAPSASR